MSTRGHLSVLLLEEHDRPRAKLAAMLGALGFGRVVQACDGPQGLAALRREGDGFGLVVCNLDLTGMDGLEFVRHASKFGVGGLILYSAHEDAVLSSAEWMARAYEVRLLGVLRSPFGREAFEPLLDRLEGHLTVYSDIVGACDPERAGRAAIDELVAALEARCFVPHYQPKVCLRTGRLVGVEALARWEHPELGMLAPVHFVDLMEENELIDPLTYLVLGQAAADSTTWTRHGLDVPIAINLSPLSLEEPDCAKRLLATIAASGATSSSFTFEITERAFAKDGNAVLENVLRLRMNGCGIAVDDFGTGYSSLQQLHRTPITELKLDRSFVRRLASSDKAISIVGSMIDLAGKLKLTTVAEGIDSDEQRRHLVELGCDVGQGYHFARPMDAAGLLAWSAARGAAVDRAEMAKAAC